MKKQVEWSEVNVGDVIDIEPDLGVFAPPAENVTVLDIERGGKKRVFFQGFNIIQNKWLPSKELQ